MSAWSFNVIRQPDDIQAVAPPLDPVQKFGLIDWAIRVAVAGCDSYQEGGSMLNHMFPYLHISCVLFDDSISSDVLIMC